MDYTAEENSETKHFWITDPQNTNKYTLLKDWLDGKDLKLHN
jgi:hypothetical protein